MVKKQIDWLELAKTSEDPTIQELMVNYETCEDDSMKSTIKDTIIQQLKDMDKKEEEEKQEMPKGLEAKEDKSLIMINKKTEELLEICKETAFKYTEEDVEKAESDEELKEIFSASREKADAIEKNRKIKEETVERKARNQLIFRIRTIGNKARHKITLNKMRNSLEKKEREKAVRDIKRKSQKFIECIELHYSFDNIVKYLFHKNEIVKIVESDPSIIEKCERIQKGFTRLWNKWKEKNSL